ncbi:hypothetical protein [Burkholderia multivorans]|uniref:hypothetical protein n=1 Tax=Burkholderia multivorans TaxID=87883 RepID=UPI0021C244B4|nr:hypothetical protein [Burkholderia multivorans]MDR9177952.1 hypothetical protein [Burkholderia multivorans]MDR9183962.1 hypothetical protein [Burkholderia multivorans]MDR9187434.1 hypothetical protein [Burkholderia multivorans]MDR9195170.1 hypothetical protein [Burkholderia multivorans]MDR9200866.1 hypothetical protein [Burkholderia multivorans]
MIERPILFSGPMVRAILEGRKTQTRRIAIPKRSPIDFIGGGPKDGPDWNDPACWGFEDANTGIWWALRGDDQCRQLPCPHGESGDLLWVRESISSVRHPSDGHIMHHVFAADGARIPRDPQLRAEFDDAMAFAHLARPSGIPSIHMPRWASRITLEITGVRAERLQSISEPDARAEGVTIEDHHMGGYCSGTYRPPSIRAFHELWDGLNAAHGYGWDTNPWVWVVQFRRIDGPENR